MIARVHSLLAASLLVGLPAVLPAQNLFTNGNFETGNYAGWTLDNAGLGDDPSCADGVEEGPFVIEGLFEFFSGPIAPNSCTLSQELATTPGATYLFSFWLDAGPLDTSLGETNSFSAAWGGTTLLALTDYSSNGYTQYRFGIVATSLATTVAFAFQNDNSLWYVDDVRAEVVPEPATMTLLATGLVGMAAARRRRKGTR